MSPEMQQTKTTAGGTTGQPYAGDAAVARPLGPATLANGPAREEKRKKKSPNERTLDVDVGPQAP